MDLLFFYSLIVATRWQQNFQGANMSKKIRCSVRYRSDAALKESYITTLVEAESESEAIERIRKQHPKATEIVAKPK